MDGVRVKQVRDKAAPFRLATPLRGLRPTPKGLPVGLAMGQPWGRVAALPPA